MVKRTRFEDAGVSGRADPGRDRGWWSLLIVRDAFDGMRRFGEFQKSLGVAKSHPGRAIADPGGARASSSLRPALGW